MVDAQVVLIAEIVFSDLQSGKEHRMRVTNAVTDQHSGRYNRRRSETERTGRGRAVNDLAQNIVRAVTEIWEDED